MSATLLMFSACAEDEPVPGITTARTQMRPLVDAACDWMFGCCSSGELVYQVGDFTVDADDCSDRIIDAISTGVPLQLQQGGLSNDPAEDLLVLALSINEGRVDVDTAAVNECATATKSRDCNEFVEVIVAEGRCTPTAVETEEDDPCAPTEMFRGKQDVGEKCDAPHECKEGLRCVDFGIAGVCALESEDGDSCFTDAECALGLICNYESGKCGAGALSGEGCGYSDPQNPIPGTETIRCAEGLTCDPVANVCAGVLCPGSPCFDVVADSDCPESFYCIGNFLTISTCQLPGEQDAPCSKAFDCQSGYCDVINEMCAPRLGNDQPCMNDAECQSGFCVGICNPSFGAGMECPSLDNRECDGGYCDVSGIMPTCAAYAVEGGPCPNGNECDPDLSLFCVDTQCLSLPFPNGTTCSDNAQCESQACFNDECATGAVIGAQCRTDGMAEPCIVGSFCETANPMAVDGICAELRRSGEACEDSSQCWGECIVRYGQLMCDTTPAAPLAEVWCDGP